MAQTTIAYLEQRYTALEKEIAGALRQSPTDDMAIADLKYRKLIIADEIQHNRLLVERTPLAWGRGDNPNVLRNRIGTGLYHTVLSNFRTSELFGGGRGRSWRDC